MSANELWIEACGLGQRQDGVQTVLTTGTLSSEACLKPVDPRWQTTVTCTCLTMCKECMILRH